jgi:hypothetical protein
MNIWRMKLRAGNHGDDMWPACLERGIAAITYQAIFNTDLTHIHKSDLDSDIKGAARSSMFHFAWEIVGGDVIFVGDSVSKSIIARGFVISSPGERAYRYNTRNPITEPRNLQVAWRHEVPVAWDTDFGPFRYQDKAPQHTVINFESAWGQFTEGHLHVPVPSTPEMNTHEAEPLNEAAYMRQTRASLRNVERLHAVLSNRFRDWLNRSFAIHPEQERNSIDVTFNHNGLAHLAELKICYGGNTRAAIREALGQILEYNYYPPRSEAQSWWLVLDHSPSKADLQYIDALKSRHKLPLTLAWPVETVFDSYPKWPSR